ncbi:hypothetical protein SPI_01481 [Niveomyces insectorum RCEF 264]|uniref:Uncharacterized protein n=1 Tax=Niveomyces insectorum RCEF 264 TaxID=1081102 RepID=A0A167YZZ9_9HYPO|nr:hypothetical protein SPI_01481 [Niveomyces insectorum RCEF 264]
MAEEEMQSVRSFFDFPLEIRRIIYQLLLCRHSPIRVASKLGLHTSILRTCHHIHDEAYPILYGENVWEIRIFDKNGEERAYALDTDHFGNYQGYAHAFAIHHMRKFDITVEIQDEEDLWVVRPAIRKVCRVLSDIPRLDYMHIRLDGCGVLDPSQFCAVLRNFGLLRVRKVNVTGVSPEFAKYLVGKMTGSGPVDDLPKMFEALDVYAGHFEFCEHLLQQACNAMDHGNVDTFKEVRTKTVEQVTSFMTQALSHLYDHDR